jgi:peptidoglycan hydrolase-like protein with peptidoglycan-binding domain
MGMYTTTTLLSAAAVCAAALTSAPAVRSASTPPAPAPTCSAVPDGATLIAAGPNGASIERTGASEPLTLPVTSALEKVVRGPDGTMWVQAFGERGVEIHRVAPDGTGGMLAIAPNLRLGTAGWLDERSAVTVLDPDFIIPNEVEMHGAVRVEYADGESRDIGPAGGPEYGVMSASIGAGRVVLGAWSDLTEAFAFYGADGTELDNWADPTDNAPYAEPPNFQFPAAALSGGEGVEELLWVEGPDFAGPTTELSGGWNLVAATAVEGTELMRVDLGDQPGLLLDADWDGRFWVGTFAEPTDDSGETRPVPNRVIVVDTDAETPAPIDVGCAAGVTATLDRTGTPQPASSPAPTSPPTTSAPATTAAPGQCDDYVGADNDYPIRRCEQGAPVHGVQLMLIHRGFDIEADGYFGQATDAAVRQFQANAGVAVDGLVGPNTWAALYDSTYLPGVDNNGKVDPWELVLDPGGSGDYAGLVFDETDDRSVITPEGEPIDGLRVRGGWLVSDPNAGPPLYSVKEVLGQSELMLWFSRSDGNRPDGTVLPWTVLDWIAVPGADTGTIASSCDLDGVLDPTISGLINGLVGGGTYTDIRAAWQFDISSGQIRDLDPARVTCLIEGD